MAINLNKYMSRFIAKVCETSIRKRIKEHVCDSELRLGNCKLPGNLCEQTLPETVNMPSVY